MSFANWDEIIETCRHHMADTTRRSLATVQEDKQMIRYATVQEAQSLTTDEDRIDHVFDTMLARQYGGI